MILPPFNAPLSGGQATRQLLSLNIIYKTARKRMTRARQCIIDEHNNKTFNRRKNPSSQEKKET
jgi:hypothetical protein